MSKVSKRSIAVAALIFLCVLLVIFNETAIEAAKDGFDIWLTAVMPAIFPFFVCTALMGEAGLLNMLSFGKNNRSRFLSNAISIFLISAVSGTPCGAKLTADLDSMGGIDENTKTGICAACSMLSPMFIVGSLSCAMLNSPMLALPIALGHYISSFTALIAVLHTSKRRSNAFVKSNAPVHFRTIKPMVALSDALGNGAVAMVKVCGSIVFFMVISRVMNDLGMFEILNKPLSYMGLNGDVMSALLIGLLEVTGGCGALAQVEGLSFATVASLASFIVSFGGISIMAQSMTFLDFKPSRYILQKFFTAVFAAVITYFASLMLLPDSVATFGTINTQEATVFSNVLSASGIFLASALGLAAIGLLRFIISGCGFNKSNRNLTRQ